MPKLLLSRGPISLNPTFPECVSTMKLLHYHFFHSPTTDFLSFPKAQMQCILLGTWNFVKLHLELKYLGSSPLALARLQRETTTLCNLCTEVLDSHQQEDKL